MKTVQTGIKNIVALIIRENKVVDARIVEVKKERLRISKDWTPRLFMDHIFTFQFTIPRKIPWRWQKIQVSGNAVFVKEGAETTLAPEKVEKLDFPLTIEDLREVIPVLIKQAIKEFERPDWLRIIMFILIIILFFISIVNLGFNAGWFGRRLPRFILTLFG